MSESFEKNHFSQEQLDESLESKLKLIESIDCGLDPKSAMVLIVLGLKPATYLDLFTWNEDLISVKRKIIEAGLFFDDISKPPFKNPKRTASMSIACSQEIANRVAEGFRDPQNNHEQLGRDMGYPQTAIDAFVGKTKVLEDQEEFLKNKEWTDEIIGFALSADHYEEEVKVMGGWWNAIKEKTPDLYKKILENRKEEDKS